MAVSQKGMVIDNIDTIILKLVDQKPMYSTEITKTIDKISFNQQKVSSSAVNGKLKKLEEKGLVQSSLTDKKKLQYSITNVGQAELQKGLSMYEYERTIADLLLSPRTIELGKLPPVIPQKKPKKPYVAKIIPNNKQESFSLILKPEETLSQQEQEILVEPQQELEPLLEPLLESLTEFKQDFNENIDTQQSYEQINQHQLDDTLINNVDFTTDNTDNTILQDNLLQEELTTTQDTVPTPKSKITTYDRAFKQSLQNFYIKKDIEPDCINLDAKDNIIIPTDDDYSTPEDQPCINPHDAMQRIKQESKNKGYLSSQINKDYNNIKDIDYNYASTAYNSQDYDIDDNNNYGSYNNDNYNLDSLNEGDAVLLEKDTFAPPLDTPIINTNPSNMQGQYAQNLVYQPTKSTNNLRNKYKSILKSLIDEDWRPEVIKKTSPPLTRTIKTTDVPIVNTQSTTTIQSKNNTTNNNSNPTPQTTHSTTQPTASTTPIGSNTNFVLTPPQPNHNERAINNSSTINNNSTTINNVHSNKLNHTISNPPQSYKRDSNIAPYSKPNTSLVKQYDPNAKAELAEHSFYKNKLLRFKNRILAMILGLLTLFTFLIITVVSKINQPNQLWFYSITVIVCVGLWAYSEIAYKVRPNVTDRYSEKYSGYIVFGVCLFLLVAVISLVLNLVFGMNLQIIKEHAVSLFLPMVLGLGFLINAILYSYLCKNKNLNFSTNNSNSNN